MSNVMSSNCCGAELRESYASETCVVRVCRDCGSLSVEHKAASTVAEPWNMANVTEVFKAALAQRRSCQAGAIFRGLASRLESKRILDYGCGQGAFVNFLVQQGMDCRGCDMKLTNCDSECPPDRFIAIQNPWEVPDLKGFDVITMLDVLEHCEQPTRLLEAFGAGGIGRVVIKVPMLFGPLGVAAEFLSNLGRHQILERLLLVGEISPHSTFFTLKGLKRLLERTGYSTDTMLRFADVGSELPQRFRTPDGSADRRRGRVFDAGARRGARGGFAVLV